MALVATVGVGQVERKIPIELVRGEVVWIDPAFPKERDRQILYWENLLCEYPSTMGGAAACGLAGHGPSAESALRRCLEKADIDVQYHAARALVDGLAAGRNVLPSEADAGVCPYDADVVHQLAADQHPSVRDAAKGVLIRYRLE